MLKELSLQEKVSYALVEGKSPQEKKSTPSQEPADLSEQEVEGRSDGGAHLTYDSPQDLPTSAGESEPLPEPHMPEETIDDPLLSF